MKLYFLAYGIIVNLITFLVFALDKRRANKDRRRIPERQLHTLTLIGGTLGAWFAMVKLRHKIKKFSFLIVTILITLLQGFLTYLYFFYL